MSESAKSSSTKPGEGIKVLIIDDDRHHAETLAEGLQRGGYECTVAASGKAGARRLDEEDFDVILTDLKMADLDGLAILRKAGRRDAGGGGHHDHRLRRREDRRRSD